jgi:F-type H+-transporting ATPase subunit epsilon
MQVNLITPDKLAFSGEASSVLLPGLDGYFEILENHAPLVGALKGGTVRIRSGQGNQEFEISSGVAEILGNKVSILADSLT